MRNKRGFTKTRKAGNLEHKPSYLILCEDEKSAPCYIKGLLRSLGHNHNRFVFEHHGSSPKNIKETVKQNIDQYDAIFCIFDKDQHDESGGHYSSLISYCNNKKNIYCINSVPCFEYWLLIHFEYHSAPLVSCEKVEEKLKKYLPEYNKGKVCFHDFRGNIQIARKNAKRSVARYNKDGDDDPMTRMGYFVDVLAKLPNK